MTFTKTLALACAVSLLGFGAAVAQTDPAAPPAASAPAADAPAGDAAMPGKKMMMKKKMKKHHAKKMMKTDKAM